MMQKDVSFNPREYSTAQTDTALDQETAADGVVANEYLNQDYVYVGEHADTGFAAIQNIPLNTEEIMWTAYADPYRQYAATGAETAETASDTALLAADVGAENPSSGTQAAWWLAGGTLLAAGILGATAFKDDDDDANTTDSTATLSNADTGNTGTTATNTEAVSNTETENTAATESATDDSDTSTVAAKTTDTASNTAETENTTVSETDTSATTNETTVTTAAQTPAATASETTANDNAADTASSSTDEIASAGLSARSATIELNEGLGSDKVLSNSDGLVTLSGSLSAGDSTLQNYLSQGWISQLQITIGDKTYLADVDADSLTYRFQAQAADLAAAAGSSIGIAFVESPVDSLEGTALADTYLLNQGLPTADTSAIEVSLQDNIDGAVISGSSGSYTVSDTFSDTTVIGGSISGAETGDTVELIVNNQTYTATVAEDGHFSAAVSTADLSTDSDKQIEARLLDSSGNTVAQSSEAYAVAASPEGGNGNISAQSELPYFINALNNAATAQGYLGESSKWAGVGSALNISYAFDGGSGIDRQSGAALGNSLAFSSQQMSDIKALLSKLTQYANITFTEAENTDSADLVFYLDDLSTVGLDDSYGYAYTGGDVHFSSTLYSADDAFSQGDGPMTVLHETLHSLGFEHPFEVGDNNSETLSEQENSTEFTLMSYNFDDLAKTDDLRVFDLAALHYNYGVNTSQRSGNDVYTFNAFNRGTSDGGVYVWDGAGVDTFDAASAEAGVTVNLTPGSWNYIGEKSQYLAATGTETVDYATLLGVSADSTIIDGWNTATNSANYVTGTQQAVYATGQSFIGYGTQIENLIGSAHNDNLTGNDADNQIEGGEGTDTIAGGLGNDSLIGGAGDDNMSGGQGNDIYYVDSSGDSVTEQAGEGSDTVYSSVDYTLAANLENLMLLGSANIRGTGNDGDNLISGNGGSNWLKGGLGNDTLTGGAGADYFVFDDLLGGGTDTITDFSYGSDKIVLSSLLFDEADLNLSGFLAFGDDQINADTRLIYNSSEQSLAYDADGSGSAAAVTFAGVSLDEQINAANLISLV